LLLKGARRFALDENDKEYIDAIASWWVNLMGTVINICRCDLQAINYFRTCTFGGLHDPIVLAEKLIEILPDNQQKCFL
jgi:adenosylmethionine-8-amino-7-oxononanoate aminotransferase